MPSLENAGASIYYEAHGAGSDVVVLAHGAGGNAAIWWQQVPYLVDQGWRVITFDHRGFARSACPPDALELARFPGDLLAVLDAESVDRVALVCQSMGGWTGLPSARLHPDRVRALVLCGTPGGVWTDEVARALAGIGERLRDAGGLTGPGGAALGDSFKRDRPDLAFLYDQISAFNQLGDPAPMLAQIASARIRPEELAGFRTPTLVVAGHRDVLFPLDAMRSVAAAIPGAELAEFEAAGHSTYYEEPDRFNALVGEFLRKHP